MKWSKFVAMLLVFALMFGSLSTALAFTDNTQLQLYDYAKNNVKYRASATTIGLIGLALTKAGGLSAVGGAAIATATGVVAAPAVAVATGTAIVVSGIAASVYGISKFIDWVW